MNALRTVAATRYVTPLREGGSVPALVEADDDGIYVVKWRGAAQGPKALVAELVGAGVARALGLPVPEAVLVDVDPVLGRAEPDPELQGPLKASGGLNFGLDYLPGAIGFEPALGAPSPSLASAIVWLDGFIANVDRTPRNPNLLSWHKELYLIDHGAALYFQHDWESFVAKADSRFPQIRDHVLLPLADGLEAADRALAARLDAAALAAIVAAIPEAWLGSDGATAAEARAAYGEFLTRRLAGPRGFVEEAAHARAQLV